MAFKIDKDKLYIKNIEHSKKMQRELLLADLERVNLKHSFFILAEICVIAMLIVDNNFTKFALMMMAGFFAWAFIFMNKLEGRF